MKIISKSLWCFSLFLKVVFNCVNHLYVALILLSLNLQKSLKRPEEIFYMSMQRKKMSRDTSYLLWQWLQEEVVGRTKGSLIFLMRFRTNGRKLSHFNL